jgi:hypothetical protein
MAMAFHDLKSNHKFQEEEDELVQLSSLAMMIDSTGP